MGPRARLGSLAQGGRPVLRYTFLPDRVQDFPAAWSWAKKLIQDLNRRDDEIQRRITVLESVEEDTDTGDGDTIINEPVEVVELLEALTLLVTDPNGGALTAGAGKACFPLDATLHGKRLTTVSGRLTAPSTTTAVTIQLRRVRLDVVDQNLLSAIITIDANEKSSTRATAQPVIDASNAIAATDDEVWVDVLDGGANAKGLSITVVYENDE